MLRHILRARRRIGKAVAATFARGVLLLLAVLAPAAAGAADLVYVWEPGCPYCRAFDRRIAPVYGRTEEGRRLPLLRVEKAELDRSALKLDRPVRYTPTFILVDDAREIGRIEGYPGEEFFFPMLSRLIERLPAPGAAGGKAGEP